MVQALEFGVYGLGWMITHLSFYYGLGIRVGVQTLAYVIDHSVEKGMGIDVYVNANTSSQRQSKEAKDPSGLQMYDVRFEVNSNPKGANWRGVHGPETPNPRP